MGYPTIQVEIAFATDPLTTPSWTDVTAYVRNNPNDGGKSIHIRRGRQDELNRIEAGTMQITLDNRDRRFDPTNAASPYAPNVVPLRRIRLRATWLAVTYTLFSGFIEDWPINWPDGYDSTVELICSDGFYYFANAPISVFFGTPDTPGTMITTILSLANWGPGDRSINTGDSVLQAWSSSEANVLGMIQRIVESENGHFWIGGDGKAYFRERHFRLTNPGSTASQATFGDSAAELPYQAIDPSFDTTFLFNDVRVTRTGGATQAIGDSASIARYFRRILVKSGLLIQTDSEANDAANWLLLKYKDIALRFTKLTIVPRMGDSVTTQAIARDLHDRVTVKRRPPGGGTIVSTECFIEGVEHLIPYNDWITNWNLSPASSEDYWVLDNASLSILDSTTRLAY